MYGFTAPLAAALWALAIGPMAQAGPVPKVERVRNTKLEEHASTDKQGLGHNGAPCWHHGRQGLIRDNVCIEVSRVE